MLYISSRLAPFFSSLFSRSALLFLLSLCCPPSYIQPLFQKSTMFLKPSTIVVLATIIRTAATSPYSIRSGGFIQYVTSTPSALILIRCSIRPQHPVYPMDRYDISYYDCRGKPDGNYIHPYNCNQFITCHSGYAIERNCASCFINPHDCLNGRIFYHWPADAWLWYHEAGCVTDPDSLVGDPEVLDEARNRGA